MVRLVRSLTVLLVEIFVVSSLLIINPINAQTQTSNAPSIEWSKTYGSYGASSVIETKDGGFIIAGFNATRLKTTPFTMYNNTAMLIKINSSGEVEWIKSYPGTYGIDWIQQSADSSYLLLGRARGYSSGFLLKADSQGYFEWNRTINLQQIMGFTAAEDGSYVIVGYEEDPATAYTFAVVLKYAADGNLLWQKTFHVDNQIGVVATVILQSNNSNSYYVAGDWNQSFWFTKLDSYGNVIWNQTYYYQDAAHVSPLTFHSINQTQDNGYILSGNDGKYTWLIKTDSDGNEQWHQKYGNYSFVSLAQQENGQYIAFSTNELVGLDNLGNVLWHEFYTKPSSNYNPSDTRVTSGILSRDNAIFVVGQVINSTNLDYTLWVTKFTQPSENPTTPTPTPTIPEFSWLVIVPLLLSVFAIAVVVRYRKVKHG